MLEAMYMSVWMADMPKSKHQDGLSRGGYGMR